MPTASSPKKKTSPVIYVAAVAAVAAVFLLTSNDDPVTASSTTKKKPTKATQAGGIITEADQNAKFPPLTLAVANRFTPLIKSKAAVLPPVVKQEGPDGIPVELTGGQGVWYYTGWVELDGRRQALLENPTTGETEYVSSGTGWKKARIGTIDVSTVVLIGPNGKSYDIPLLDYGAIPGQVQKADPNALPMKLPSGAIAGAIGNGGTLGVRPIAGATPNPANVSRGTATMTLDNGQTVQVQLDPTAIPGNDNSNGNNRRRNGRRNRNNNNSGDFNNAP